ncbi:stage II sporulation protein P [Bacillus sp. B1-b2]|uniref:stage II sporulation protein P n=1 Tax=Bacillus sp. B1-b2 TaxID=2653201 RepID=UPI001261D314|nr:stage II sporulation protein P [Bacillus sp. B1-b2]KAB7664146.1 stage II sporulation protein P [Bacillus sp. B1-b2]
MKKLNGKRLKRLLIILLILFAFHLMYIVYLLINDPHSSVTSLYEISDNKEQDDDTIHKAIVDTTSDSKSSIKDKISKEVKPKPNAIKKDGTFDSSKMESKLRNLKTPKIYNKPAHSTFGKQVAFIYFSHNRESFLPYFKQGTAPESAYHSKFNITLVGKRLGHALKLNGIGNKVNTEDIISMLNESNLDFNSSYQMSRNLILKEKMYNRNNDMYFDIHRDSLPREYTTTAIGGVRYAKISFVVGSGHKDYKKNLKFTNDINDLINKNYPNLSRGVILKSPSEGNGIYNQDLSPNSVIIELGGVENQIDELYRTADILANVISQYYWENIH